MTHYREIKDSNPVISEVLKEIEIFTDWIFQHHRINKVRGSKVIHDGVWGTNRFDSFEIALIDTPLIQRLRQIHQTGNTFLTYPSTRHTRFEHTLGVTAQIGNLIRALGDKFGHSPGLNEKNDLIGRQLSICLRLSAILHDCGHGPCSHTSEEIYGAYPEIIELKKYDPFKTAGPAEVLTYLIIDSDTFRRFLDEFKKVYNIDLDKDLMKEAIVGYVRNKDEHYKIDMLNGPFDADKLDYLFRDGHFSGLPLKIDLDRLWYSLDINCVGDRRRLTIDAGGVSCLEQILFSKMHLFPAVYHHHKVRACDCMFKGIIEYMREKSVGFNRLSCKDQMRVDFNRAVHFLYFTDFDLYDYALAEMDKNLHTLLHNLQYRRTLKRAAVISRDSVREEESLDEFQKYLEDPTAFDGKDYYRYLANRIWEEAGSPGLLQEVWVDCPGDPSFEEAHDTWVSPLGEDQEALPLSSFFKAEQYANQYKHKKWRSHVFCNPEHVDRIAEASVKVFKEECNIELMPLAFHLCHLSPPKNLPN